MRPTGAVDSESEAEPGASDVLTPPVSQAEELDPTRGPVAVRVCRSRSGGQPSKRQRVAPWGSAVATPMAVWNRKR